MKLRTLLLLAVVIFGATKNSFAQVPSYVPADGLLGWWPFDGNANDKSGNNNHGSVSEAVLTSDRLGHSNSAYYFDGINDAITTNLSFAEGNTSKSYSVWLKFDSLDHRGWFISNSVGCLGAQKAAFGGFVNGAGSKEIYFHGNGPAGDVLFESGFDTVHFYHIAVTYDRFSVKCYVNGSLDTAMARTLNTGSGKLIFGTRAVPPGSGCVQETFLGVLDDIGVWDRDLSASEIKKLYTGGATGIAEVQASNLNVFPNPAYNRISINAMAPASAYIVMDCMGRTLLSGAFNLSQEIDISMLAPGTYFVQLAGRVKAPVRFIKSN